MRQDEIKLIFDIINKKSWILGEFEMEKKAKKRKWLLLVVFLFVKGMVDIVLLESKVSAAGISGDYSAVSELINLIIPTDMLLGLVAMIGTKIWINRAIRDERFELKYKFWTVSIWALFTACLGFVKGIQVDLNLFNGERIIAEKNGEELMGHAVPAFTILYMAFGLVYFTYFLLSGIAGQMKYRKGRLSAKDKQN